MFKKESLEKLKEKVDLLEVVSDHVELKRAGTAHKGLCPFHEEKSPSFTIQRGDTHYHCYGCGAHGDAIQFLVEYLNLSFVEAVENLGEKFDVVLEKEDGPKEKGIDKRILKDACERASEFFQFYLLRSEEGKAALDYLFKRGITIDFIQRFGIGYAPSDSALFLKVMKGEKLSEAVLRDVGLLGKSGGAFFRERITFPIRDPAGNVIGFSARKLREETFGGKYINTPETALFKKSRVLFGLNYCRRRLAKERRAIIVEGQIDALRLIEVGLNVTVAALGTAFGEDHVRELKQLGVREVFLLFDGDQAGSVAASKVGDLFQKEGIEVKVPRMPEGLDPDSFLAKQGVEGLTQLLEEAQAYLAFQVVHLGKELNLDSPAGKAELVKVLKKQIEGWEDPVMVHESLRKVASLVHVPEGMVGVKQTFASNLYVNKQKPGPLSRVDPNRVLELDLLRWLILNRKELIATAHCYLQKSHFWTPACRSLYELCLEKEELDPLTIAAEVPDTHIIDEILRKKVNPERYKEQFIVTVQKMLDRHWMQQRELIKQQINSGSHSEEELLELAKQFDALKNERMQAKLVEE